MILNDIKVGIIGFGSVGKQLFNNMTESGYAKEDIIIFDDHYISKEISVYKFNEYKNDEFSSLYFIPALGYLSKILKNNIIDFLKENNRNFYTFIHPKAFVSKNAIIGKGVIIYPLCNIDQGVFIDDGVIIHNSSIVSHDTQVGKCTYISAGVTLCGFINIGKFCFIGAGASITNNIKIGDNSTIALGSCVTKDVPEDSFLIGNPSKLKSNIKLV